MDNKKGLLQDRLLRFAVRVISVAKSLPRDDVGVHVCRQVTRSSTSAGANYQEALGSESRNDFTHKMQIVLKEWRETHYWPRLIEEARLLPPQRLEGIIGEANELIAMTVRSVATAKRRGADMR